MTGFADYSISATYRRLRYLISGILVVFPLLIAASGYWIGDHTLQPSLSDYYFVVVDGGTPRTLFIFFLASLSAALIAYKGLGTTDDIIHNLAGVFSLGVALFPMECTSDHPHCRPGWMPILHLPSAGLLYISALFSVLYSGGSYLGNALDKLPEKQRWFSKLHHLKLLSIILMTVGIVAFFIHTLYPGFAPNFRWIFWVEYCGFFGFGLYWFRLMQFINAVNEEGRQLNQIAKRKHFNRLSPRSNITTQNTLHYVPNWKEIP